MAKQKPTTKPADEEFTFTSEQLKELLHDLKESDKIERIRNWSGMAMQGMLADSGIKASMQEFALRAFNIAEAMEAEYQNRYGNE